MFFRCYRCLYPNTKPDIWFDETGLCSACIAYDKRKLIDWDKRREEFIELVCNNRGRTHDCIVACSGGKDSTAQIVKCLELGLRPLAVTATTDHLSSLGRRNLDNISNLCDHIEVTPHKPTRNKIARFALEEVGDISWCEHHLIWSVPAREAVARQIPIVLYGECPQNEYGAGPAGSERTERLTEGWVHEFGGLLGLRLSDVADISDIESRHLELYRYPSGHLQAVWMGNYFDWDGRQNAMTAMSHGLTATLGNIEGSLFGYENLDNLQTGIHDYMRWLKFGYKRADDIASNHIRRGRLSREHGAHFAHAANYDAKTYLGVSWLDILANIGVGWTEFEEIVERFTNKPLVQWSSKPESYQCFFSGSTAPSRESSSSLIAASAA